MINFGLSKPAIFSKTIIGGVVAFFPAAAEVVNYLAATPLIPPHTAAILGAIGGGLAIVGRVVAKADIQGLLFERR